jgi:5-methylcytosine-specific restriction endonuclease McrA
MDRERHNERKRQVYRKRRALELCVACGIPAEKGHAHCTIHRLQQANFSREYQAQRCANRRALGICRECENPVEEGYARCPQHRLQRNLELVEKRRVAMKEGKCRTCLRQPPLKGSRLCLRCYLREVSVTHFGTGIYRDDLLKMFESQDGLCALSGRFLTLGVNAELDHIIPPSRGGSRGIKNTQWVLFYANRLKSDMTEDELFLLIEDVHRTMKARKEAKNPA